LLRLNTVKRTFERKSQSKWFELLNVGGVLVEHHWIERQRKRSSPPSLTRPQTSRVHSPTRSWKVEKRNYSICDARWWRTSQHFVRGSTSRCSTRKTWHSSWNLAKTFAWDLTGNFNFPLARIRPSRLLRFLFSARRASKVRAYVRLDLELFQKQTCLRARTCTALRFFFRVPAEVEILPTASRPHDKNVAVRAGHFPWILTFLRIFASFSVRFVAPFMSSDPTHYSPTSNCSRIQLPQTLYLLRSGTCAGRVPTRGSGSPRYVILACYAAFSVVSVFFHDFRFKIESFYSRHQRSQNSEFTGREQRMHVFDGRISWTFASPRVWCIFCVWG